MSWRWPDEMPTGGGQGLAMLGLLPGEIGALTRLVALSDGEAPGYDGGDSQNQDGDAYGIYAKQFIADGTARGSEFLVNTTTVENQNTPAVAMDDVGNFVVAWRAMDQDSPCDA